MRAWGLRRGEGHIGESVVRLFSVSGRSHGHTPEYVLYVNTLGDEVDSSGRSSDRGALRFSPPPQALRMHTAVLNPSTILIHE